MPDLLYINLAYQRIARALRQEVRMQEAYRRHSAEMARVGHVDGVFPESRSRLHTQFQDELYFLIIAVRQAIAARTLLAQEGDDLPATNRL